MILAAGFFFGKPNSAGFFCKNAFCDDASGHSACDLVENSGLRRAGPQNLGGKSGRSKFYRGSF